MTSNLTDIANLESWTRFVQGLVGYSGDRNIIDSFDWGPISRMTVAEYLNLIDLAEDFVETFDWSALTAQIPFIRSLLAGQGLPQATIDEAIGFLEKFIAGDYSLITNGFAFLRAQFDNVAPATLLIEAIQGGGRVTTATENDDTLVGTAADDNLSGLGGNDDISGKAGNDRLNGNAGRDRIDGDGGNDRINGGGGKDRLTGDKGNDKIKGGGGNDTIKGDAGRDTIVGGKGKDKLFGGDGPDRFIFRAKDGADTICDFEIGSDRIKIAGTAKLGDIGFAQAGDAVMLSVGALDILVEDTTVAELRDAGNFLF